jgi:hypothetical protein
MVQKHFEPDSDLNATLPWRGSYRPSAQFQEAFDIALAEVKTQTTIEGDEK